MILRLDPRYPLLWRSPSSLQLGLDPARVVLHDLSESDERMLAALAVGVTQSGLELVSSAGHRERAALLEAVRPALETAAVETEPVVVAVIGRGPLADAIAGALAHSGLETIAAGGSADLDGLDPDLAILTGDYVLAPELHGTWLRRDTPHLPVVFSDTGVLVGPIVEPGSGPCLLCLELHHRDRDAAWPALATQLLGRRSRAVTPVLVLEAAATAARITLERLARSTPATVAGAAASERIDAVTGERTRLEWHAHPECGCGGIEALAASPGRRESDWGSVVRIGPVAAPRPS